jgi:hypothetical protein
MWQRVRAVIGSGIPVLFTGKTVAYHGTIRQENVRAILLAVRLSPNTASHEARRLG